MGYISSVERGKESLCIDGAEPLCMRIRAEEATIVFEIDGNEFPPRRYTLQEIRDALEDWRDYLRKGAREKKSQGA